MKGKAGKQLGKANKEIKKTPSMISHARESVYNYTASKWKSAQDYNYTAASNSAWKTAKGGGAWVGGKISEKASAGYASGSNMYAGLKNSTSSTLKSGAQRLGAAMSKKKEEPKKPIEKFAGRYIAGGVLAGVGLVVGASFAAALTVSRLRSESPLNSDADRQYNMNHLDHKPLLVEDNFMDDL